MSLLNRRPFSDPFFDEHWHRHHHHHHHFDFDRHFREIEQHFPKSWHDRDLWIRPRFESFHSHFEEMEREMRRHFEEMDRHFEQIMKKSGLEVDSFGHKTSTVSRVENGNLFLDITLPKNIDPNKISVSVKDGDIIVQADEKSENQNERSEMHYYRRSTLPHNADLDKIKADLINGNRLSITAPVSAESRTSPRNSSENMHIPESHVQMPGGFGGASPATEEVQKLVDDLSQQIKSSTGKDYPYLKAVNYKSQVVAGTNFIVKVDGGDEHLHVKIFRPLPHTGDKASLSAVQKGKSAGDSLELF